MSSIATATTPSEAPSSQTLRFAVVLTGGVSLAVWIGGVTRELNLLDSLRRGTTASGSDLSRNSRSVSTDGVRDYYGALCRVLGWDVEIDVLAGTSAGGINAALLGVCTASNGDLGDLRDLWLEQGEFLTLLRDPVSDAAPRSLLQGDGVLLEGIASALRKIRTTVRPGGDSNPTWLNITTTLLRGETSRFTDSYGTTVQDSDHLGLFTFTETDLGDRANDAAVALAARSSASFPGAFEPAFVPALCATDAEHPAMSRFLSATVDHYASDGGQLENQPIAPALGAIFDRPDAEDPVRRVMLYVVPSTAAPAPSKPESATAPPTLGRALLCDFQASRSQSIKSALDDITTHNATVRVRTDGTRRLARLAESSQNVRLVDPAAFEAYRQTRAAEIAGPIIEVLLTQLFGQDIALPGTSMSPAELTDAAVQALNSQWFPTSLPDATDSDGLARLGLLALEDVRTMLLELRTRAYLLVNPSDGAARRELGELWRAVSWPVDEAGARGAAVHQTLWSIVQETAVPQPSSQDGEAVRRANRDHAARAAMAWASKLSLDLDDGSLAQIWKQLGASLPAFVSRLDELASADCAWEARYPLSADRRKEATQYVADFVAYLKPAPLDRAVELHVLSHLLLPRGRATGQPVEFIQVSADTRTSLDPSRLKAVDKLTGLQLNHFGAFYRGSWRANDWMWGRLDGAGWIAHVLLSPQRIIDLADQSGDPMTFLASFTEQLAGLVGEAVPSAVTAELADLFNPAHTQPASLPETAMWVAAPAQQIIAAEELAYVALQLQNEAPDIPPNTDEASFLRQYRQSAGLPVGPIPNPPPPITDPRVAGAVLQSCLVSKERLNSQKKSPLFVQTAVKSAAVLAAAANASESKPPAALRPALLLARHGTRAAYEIVSRVTKGRDAQTALAAIGAFAVGVALVANSNGFLDALGAVFLTAGVVLALAVMRPIVVWVAKLTVALAAVALILAGFVPELRDHVFPWLRVTALPWLSTHGYVWALIVLLVLLPPITTVAALPRQLLRKRRAPGSR